MQLESLYTVCWTLSVQQSIMSWSLVGIYRLSEQWSSAGLPNDYLSELRTHLVYIDQRGRCCNATLSREDVMQREIDEKQCNVKLQKYYARYILKPIRTIILLVCTMQQSLCDLSILMITQLGFARSHFHSAIYYLNQ